MKTTRSTCVAGLLVAMTSTPATAEMIEQSGTFGGLKVDYRVVLPDGYDPAQSYPLVLHLVGGPQTMGIVESSLGTDWQQLAEQQGLVVVSPASPNGQLFFAGADVVFPEFLDFLVEQYHPPEGRMHVTGHSNGGLSAFHIASLYPDYFLSVTGYPGLLDVEARLPALAGLCIFMHVGDQDTGWWGAMQAQAETMRSAGLSVAFTVEPGQIHRLDTTRDNLAQRLFDELAAARQGC